VSATPAQLDSGRFYGRVAERQDTRGIMLSEVVHGTPRSLPRHLHGRTYLSLLLGGRYEEEVGRRRYKQSRLSVTMLPAGIEHRDRVGVDGARFFIVEIPAGWLEATLAGDPPLTDRTALAGMEALSAMLRLYREFRQWDVGSAAVAEELLAAVADGVDAASGAPGDDMRWRPSWLPRAEAMVRDGFRGPITLADLAREAGVNRAHLSRAFRQYLGHTPGELARALRVRWVCERIHDPRRTLADLAFDAGFADQAHMTRTLARSVGMTPGRLRALLARD